MAGIEPSKARQVYLLLRDRLHGRLTSVQNRAPRRNLIGRKLEYVSDHTDRIGLLGENR